MRPSTNAERKTNSEFSEFIIANKDIINALESPSFPVTIYLDRFNQLKETNPSFNKVFSELMKKANLSRSDVSKYFRDDIYKGYIAAMLWGGINATRPSVKGDKTGTTTQAYHAFNYSKDTILVKLRDVKSKIDNNRILDAFESMLPGRKNQINGVGISFFTKILYFMTSDNLEIIPLIYDKWGRFMHVALLSEYKFINIRDFYHVTIYEKTGKTILKSNKPSTELYMDFIKRMSDFCKDKEVGISSADKLEEFLFGWNFKKKNQQGNPRQFLYDYVSKFIE